MMSTLRKLKRKEAAPKIKQAKKIASEYMAKEKIAHNATLAQSSKINKQAVVRINTCVFKVLREIFKMSGKKIAYLSNQIDFQVSCLNTKQPGTKETYLTYEVILDALPAETGWTFPAYELKGKDRLEIRLMTDEKLDLLNRVKTKMIHFAWDNPDDKITPKMLEKYVDKISGTYRKKRVYILTNFNSTHEQDLMRVYKLRDMGYDPYIMIYQKWAAPKITHKLQRWVNNKFIFRTVEIFGDYKGGKK